MNPGPKGNNRSGTGHYFPWHPCSYFIIIRNDYPFLDTTSQKFNAVFPVLVRFPCVRRRAGVGAAGPGGELRPAPHQHTHTAQGQTGNGGFKRINGSCSFFNGFKIQSNCTSRKKYHKWVSLTILGILSKGCLIRHGKHFEYYPFPPISRERYIYYIYTKTRITGTTETKSYSIHIQYNAFAYLRVLIYF